LAKDDIQRLTSKEIIHDIVQEDQTLRVREKEEFLNRVHGGARTLFAMLVFARLPLYLLDVLLRHGFSDQNLPLSEGANFGNEWEEYLDELDFIISTTQWMFLAPELRRDGVHQKLDPNAILPISSKREVGTGAFSVVYSVQIEPAHQQIYPSENVSSSRQSFKSICVD
jgi:hypothetical protein